MTRVIHTGQALVDVVIEVPDLPARGQNVMATSVTDYAGGAVTVLVAAARFGADCVHAGAHGTGPHGDLIRAALAAEGIAVCAPPVTDHDTGICVVLIEPSAERTFVTTLGAEREITVESLATSAPAARRPRLRHRLLARARAARANPLLAWLRTLDEGVVVVLDPGCGVRRPLRRRPRGDARASPTSGRATPRRRRTSSAPSARSRPTRPRRR